MPCRNLCCDVVLKDFICLFDLRNEHHQMIVFVGNQRLTSARDILRGEMQDRCLFCIALLSFSNVCKVTLPDPRSQEICQPVLANAKVEINLLLRVQACCKLVFKIVKQNMSKLI